MCHLRFIFSRTGLFMFYSVKKKEKVYSKHVNFYSLKVIKNFTVMVSKKWKCSGKVSVQKIDAKFLRNGFAIYFLLYQVFRIALKSINPKSGSRAKKRSSRLTVKKKRQSVNGKKRHSECLRNLAVGTKAPLWAICKEHLLVKKVKKFKQLQT